MSPRFRRYLRRSLPSLILVFALVLAANWINKATGTSWFKVDPILAAVVWVSIFFLNWLIRTDPQNND